jgi:hypothetical protein
MDRSRNVPRLQRPQACIADDWKFSKLELCAETTIRQVARMSDKPLRPGL